MTTYDGLPNSDTDWSQHDTNVDWYETLDEVPMDLLDTSLATTEYDTPPIDLKAREAEQHRINQEADDELRFIQTLKKAPQNVRIGPAGEILFGTAYTSPGTPVKLRPFNVNRSRIVLWNIDAANSVFLAESPAVGPASIGGSTPAMNSILLPASATPNGIVRFELFTKRDLWIFATQTVGVSWFEEYS